MKKLILLSSCIFACVCFLNAQPPQNNNAGNLKKPLNNGQFQQRPPMQNQFLQNHPLLKRKMGMLAGLHVTPDQMKKGKEINQDFHKQLADLQKNDKISLGEYKTKLAALKKDRKEKIKSLLTDKQKNQIAQQMKNREINAKVRQAGMLERMKLTLNLSEEQIAKIKTNQAAIQSKRKAIRENDNLLPEQKREQIQSLNNERKKIAKSILTPEQLIKADSLRKNFRGNFRGGWNMNNRPPVSK